MYNENEAHILVQILNAGSPRGVLLRVLNIVKSPDYFSTELAPIFRAVLEIDALGHPISSGEVLDNLSAETKMTFVNLLSTVPCGSSNSLDYDCRKVATAFLEKKSAQIVDNFNNDKSDIADRIDHATNAFSELVTQARPSSTPSIGCFTDKAFERILHSVDHPNELTGIPTGFRSIDKTISGLQPSNLIIIAARPAMGKTAFVQTMLLNIAKAGYPVGLISLEMSADELTDRTLKQHFAMASSVTAQELASGCFNRSDLANITKQTAQLPYYIEDSQYSLSDIRTTARILVRERNVKVIAIDYLQLVNNTSVNRNASRENEVASVSRTLKALAKELKVPIVALAQLNRQLANRNDPVPQLSDLRESGSIEQDADLVAFLHRPEYYDPTDLSLRGDAKFIIAKNRHGAIRNINLRFIPELTLFTDVPENIIQQFMPKPKQQAVADDALPF